MAISSPSSIPEGLDVIDTADGVIIRRRWLSWLVIPLLIFAIVWDSFLFFWYSMAFGSSNSPWIMKVFPLGHVGLGIFITYSVFTMLFNRTDVTVSTHAVQVKSGPIPAWGNREVSAGSLNNVLVRTRTGNRNSVTYNVMYVDRDRKERKLVASLPQPEQAEFIAATIRQRLDLRSPAA